MVLEISKWERDGMFDFVGFFSRKYMYEFF